MEETKQTKEVSGIKVFLIILAVVAVATAVVTFVAVNVFNSNKLSDFKGTWENGASVSFYFDGEGNGKLTDKETFDFVYTADEENLTLDFTSNDKPDVTYHYSVKEDSLVLLPTEKGDGTYMLKRSDK